MRKPRTRKELREASRNARRANEMLYAQRALKQRNKALVGLVLLIVGVALFYLPFVALAAWAAHLLIGWAPAIIGVGVLAIGFAAFAFAIVQMMKM